MRVKSVATANHLRALTSSMQLSQSIRTDPISNCLDRQNLVQLKKRFLQVNEDRLLRTRSALNHQQELFLNALPLLFHWNHPMLPGFVSHNTPSGVCNFKPGKRDLSYAKTLARSFCSTGGYHGENIWGIYLMGSVGTLAQSHHSDFDVWLCHKPGLSKEALTELKQKCERISHWAKTLRLDAHFFLMDCDAFVAGQELSLDEESSGSAQRVLLLDEFYRTALYVAGRLPLWWSVPAAQEQEYDSLRHELLDKRFLRPDTVLDFGGMGRIPDGEFIGAGIWQLYKAIGSPYKSVLKLLLMEAYVHDFPNIAPLSLTYKEQIYRGNLDVNELDPYVMIYRRIERYLIDQNDLTRLELVRRCLYFKVNKPLSRTPSKRSKSWQRLLLESLTQEWGWTADYIHLLDQRSHWKTLQVKEERNQLVHALNHSYDVLSDFAQRSGAARSISAMELTVLGRKLQAAFERRPGKLDWVNPGISGDMSESNLHFVEARTTDLDSQRQPAVWQLYSKDTGLEIPLRQTDSPVELLLWSYTNRVIDGSVHFDVSQAPSTSEGQLKRTLMRIQQWLPLPLPVLDHHVFERNAAPTHVLMLFNIAAETPSPFGGHVHRLSDNSDPFCYGGLAENLVASVDVIIRNSWQEFTSHRFHGRDCMIQALKEYLALCLPGSHQAPPLLEVECLGSAHASLISQRSRQWFREITMCYYTGTKPPATRFVFAMGKHHYSLQFKGAKLITLEHKSIAQLNHYLGEPQRRYSPVVVDSRTLVNHPLKLIARQASARAIHVFFKRQPATLEIFVMDERGSLVSLEADLTPKLNALNGLHAFLRNALLKIQQQDDYTVTSDCGVHPIEFHEIREDHLHHLSLAPRVITPDLQNINLLPLQAKVSCSANGQFEYSFLCQQQSFEWAVLRNDVFYATAQYILEQRQAQERYPVFITALDLDDCKEQISSTRNLQISHYLRIKIELEKKLSRAVLSLT